MSSFIDLLLGRWARRTITPILHDSLAHQKIISQPNLAFHATRFARLAFIAGKRHLSGNRFARFGNNDFLTLCGFFHQL
jgi:hypothetical protein